MKAIMVIWILLAGVVIEPAQKQHTESNPQQHQEAAKRNPEPAKPANALSCQQEATNNYYLPEQKTRNWHDAFAPPTWPDWGLVVVGIGGIIAAICTLRKLERQSRIMLCQAAAARIAAEATEKAAEATEDSATAAANGVKVQRAAMQQWVDIGNWRGDWKFTKNGLPRLNISFDLVNPTSLPLTITCISVTPGEPINTNKEIPLNPKEPYVHNITFDVTDEHAHQSSNDSLFLDFIVFVIYLDAFEDKQLKRFGKSCLFNLSTKSIAFMHYRGILPHISGNEEEEDDN